MRAVTFGDKDQQPTMEEMLAAVGSKRRMWDDIAGFLASSYTVREGMKFYGKNFGWIVQYRRAGRLLVSLYPRRDSLAAQLILSENDWKTAQALTLGERMMNALGTASHYPEGIWLLLEVEDETDVADVKKIVLMKSPPPTRRGSSKQYAGMV